MTSQIYKVEVGQDERGFLWYVYVNGVPFGPPVVRQSYAFEIAKWLDQCKDSISLNAPDHHYFEV